MSYLVGLMFIETLEYYDFPDELIERFRRDGHEVEKLTSVNRIPATPNMANRQCTSSAWTYHFKAAGFSPSPRGSKPKSPGSLQQDSCIDRLSDRRAVEVRWRFQSRQPCCSVGASSDCYNPSSCR
jgi:hypothetical protein